MSTTVSVIYKPGRHPANERWDCGSVTREANYLLLQRARLNGGYHDTVDEVLIPYDAIERAAITHR